jgi:hypothetical protein
MSRVLAFAMCLASAASYAASDVPHMEPVPGGYFCNVAGYGKLEDELARLYRREAELGAKNAQLNQELAKEQAELRPTPLGWAIVVGTSVLAGVFVGAFLIPH